MKKLRLLVFALTVISILFVTASASPFLGRRVKLGLDLRGGYDLVYQIDSHGRPLTQADKQAILTAVEVRADGAGLGSPLIELQDHNQIHVQLAGTHDAQTANAVIGQTAQLKIYGGAKVKERNGTLVPYSAVTASIPGSKVVPQGQPLVSGQDLNSDASWGQVPVWGYVVNVSFKNPVEWESITSKYLHRQIYTFLGTRMISAARVNAVIANGKTMITGMTEQQCVVLADELRAGALPYPLHLISSTSVGPSLGRASLHATLLAGAVASVLIALFMAGLYRVAGLLADIGLVAYSLVTLVLFSGLGIVMTLPGLAALVLGVGMAVDANIITYERIKDELHSGKSLVSSIILGQRRALRPILDSNVTTFIAGVVMYIVGQGDIKGFALALMLSITTSLLTAVLLGRLLLLLLAKARTGLSPKWFGFERGRVHREKPL